MKKTLIVLTLMIGLIGCSKDEGYKTDGQLIGEELIQLTNSNGITLATAYRTIITLSGQATTGTDEFQKSFTINGPIIQVGSTYYNLNTLKSYKIVNTEEQPNILTLFFDEVRNY